MSAQEAVWRGAIVGKEEEEIRDEEEEKREPRVPKSPAKVTIADRSIFRGRTIQIVRNQWPRGNPHRYRMTTLDKLLVDAVEILSLGAKAKRAFRKDGTAVNSVDDVEDQEVLYISCGEAFGFAMPSPVKRKKVLPASPSKQAAPQQKTPEKTPEKPKLTRRQRELQMFNRVVALAQRTTEENMKIATASVYASLDKQQRNRINVVQTVHDDVQDGLFMQHLLRQQMIPMIPVVDDNLRDLAVEVFRGIKIEEVKFVVGGPRQSGKTTLLYTLATVLLKKIRMSSEVSKYLVFPMNFELNWLFLGSPAALMRIFVSTAFDSLEYCLLKVVPYLDTLRKWFTLSVFGTLLTPPVLQECSFVDMKALSALCKSLNTALNANGDHSLEHFVEKMCRFPRDFAQAFGMKDALFVMDGFDYANVELRPSPELFPRSLKSVWLSDYLCLELAKSPYLISMQDEQAFMECFSCDDAALLDTEGMITEPYADGYLRFREPALKLRVTDCLGCPGYIARFQKLWNLVVAAHDNASYPSRYSMIRTMADVSRRRTIKQEAMKLITLLFTAGNENFSKELLNEIIESDRVTVDFVETEMFEEEEDEATDAPDAPVEQEEEPEQEAPLPVFEDRPLAGTGMVIKLK